MSYFCTHHTTLTIYVTFLYVSHCIYCTCHISVRITLCIRLLCMSHYCTYHTVHMLTVCVICIALHLLYMSHFCMYHTALTVHVTFLYVSHCAYCTCHISVRITLHLLYMSHFCTYHTTLVHITLLYVSHYACLLCISHFCTHHTTLTIHVTFLYVSHYAYCTCHISVRITLHLLYISHFCTMHMLTVFVSHYAHYVTQIIYLLFSNLGGKGCSSPVRNCSFKAIMLELFHIGWPTNLYTLFQKIFKKPMLSATCDILLPNKLCVITVVKNFNVACVYVKFKHFHESYIIHLFVMYVLYQPIVYCIIGVFFKLKLYGFTQKRNFDFTLIYKIDSFTMQYSYSSAIAGCPFQGDI